MGLFKIICDTYRFYEENFQPHMVFRDDEIGGLIHIIRFGPKISFGVPDRMLTDVEAWIHEFIEFCIQKLLIEYGAIGTISFLYKKGSEYFEWDHGVSHIIAASTGMSGFNEQTVDADTYWGMMIERYSKRILLPLSCAAGGFSMLQLEKCLPLKGIVYNWMDDSLCDHY